MVNCQWSIVNGQWSIVNGQLSMVNGQWSIVNGRTMPQQFQVPQFIERESRLIGPFTIRQSAILGGGGAALFIMWFILQKWLFFLLAFPFALFFALIAFLRINGRPLLDFIGSVFSFFISPQLYIWQKRIMAAQKAKKKPERMEKFAAQSVVTSKEGIREVAKRLDTLI